MISLLSNSILWLFTDNTASATQKNESVIGHEIIDDLAQQFSQHLLMATEICQNVLHRNIIFFTYIPFPFSIAPILDVYKHGHCALSAKSSSVYPAMIDDISRLYQAIAIKKIEYLRSVIITRVWVSLTIIYLHFIIQQTIITYFQYNIKLRWHFDWRIYSFEIYTDTFVDY